MAVRNIKTIRPKIWIPPKYQTVYKLTIDRSSGTVDNITDNIINAEIEDIATEGVGRFEFSLWNVDESYTKIWSGGETFKYYKDYAVGVPTSLRFLGKIEKVSYQGNKVKVTGRAIGRTFQDITVTQNYTGIDCSDILKDLIDKYGDGTFTYTNVTAVSGVTSTVNWYQKNFWDCVQELCTNATYDCYVDKNKDFNFFANGSRNNTTDALVHDYNLIEVGDFGTDQSLIKNRIIVYGAVIDNVQMLYTADDETSQELYGIKEEIINDDNVTTYAQAVDVGNFILQQRLNPSTVGEGTGILLATVQPGENIRLSSPLDNLPPTTYNCIGYVDKLGDMLTTTVKISKETRTVSHIFKKLVESDNKKQYSATNPNEMRFGYTLRFDEDSGSHGNTEIVAGSLKLVSGASKGIWISDIRTLPKEIETVYLTMTYTGSVSVYVGVNGVSSQSQIIPENQSFDIENPTGFDNDELTIFVNLNSSDAKVDSLSLMYKYV